MTYDEEVVLFCAFRYALGRMSYVVDSVANQIERNVKKISTKELSLYVKEIDEAEKQNKLGMIMDVDRWDICRLTCSAEMKKRSY